LSYMVVKNIKTAGFLKALIFAALFTVTLIVPFYISYLVRGFQYILS
jgi:hypothetical protein